MLKFLLPFYFTAVAQRAPRSSLPFSAQVLAFCAQSVCCQSPLMLSHTCGHARPSVTSPASVPSSPLWQLRASLTLNQTELLPDSSPSPVSPVIHPDTMPPELFIQIPAQITPHGLSFTVSQSTNQPINQASLSCFLLLLPLGLPFKACLYLVPILCSAAPL